MITREMIVVGLSLPIELVGEVDRLADGAYESRAGWMRKAILDRLAREAGIKTNARKPRRSTKELIRTYVAHQG